MLHGGAVTSSGLGSVNHKACAANVPRPDRRKKSMLTRDIAIKPISGALVAVIEGVNLGSRLDNSTMETIHRALLDHCVIFFRDQTMTPEQHIEFGRRFGTLNVHDYVKAMDGHPEIIVVAKNENDTKN